MAYFSEEALNAVLRIYLNGGTAPAPASYYAALLNFDPSVETVTFLAGSSTITSSTVHDLIVDTRVVFSTTGVLPAALTAGVVYWVVSTPSTVTFTVSATKGGSAITMATVGSGVHTSTEQFLSAEDTLAVHVNHERASGSGYTTRPNVNFDDAIWDDFDRSAEAPVVTVQITPSGADLDFTHILVIRDGSATIGDTTGGVAIVEAFADTQTLQDLVQYNIPIAVAAANVIFSTVGVAV